MHSDDASGEVHVLLGSELGTAHRPVAYSATLSAEEMNPTVRHDDGMTIVVGSFSGHSAQVGTWIGPDGLLLSEAEEAVQTPVSAEPVRYVVCQVDQFGMESQDVVSVGSGSVDMPADQVEAMCQSLLSDLLCGVTASAAVEARFGGSVPKDRTIVGRFPAQRNGDRHGTFLLALTQYSRTLRVVGQCQTYLRSHDYDASAWVFAVSSDPMFTDETEMIVRQIARALMNGVPVRHAISDSGAGFPRAYEVNAREEDAELELTAAEWFIARKLARLSDQRRAARADQVWASAGPVVWPGLSELEHEAVEARDEEEGICDELWFGDILESADVFDESIDGWIFREGISYHQLIRKTLAPPLW